MKRIKTFRPGERVRIERGALAGFEGAVVSHEGKRLVKVMAEMFGQMRAVKMDVDSVEVFA